MAYAGYGADPMLAGVDPMLASVNPYASMGPDAYAMNAYNDPTMAMSMSYGGMW